MGSERVVHKTGTWTYWLVRMPLCIPHRRFMPSFPPTSHRWKRVTCKKCLRKKGKKS